MNNYNKFQWAVCWIAAIPALVFIAFGTIDKAWEAGDWLTWLWRWALVLAAGGWFFHCIDVAWKAILAELRPTPVEAEALADVPQFNLEEEARGLRDRGQRIEALRLVREKTGVGLSEAKAFVDAL
jgi:hypothetical protein